MLKLYLKDLFDRFINSKLITKILIVTLICIEIFLAFICFYKVDYELTTPGSLGNPYNTVQVKTDNSPGYIHTVSVMTFNDMSLLQYWLMKNEVKVEISDPEDDVLSNEDERKYGIVSKRISINNAIMYAYKLAKEKDDSINLVSTFKGLIVSLSTNKESTVEPDHIITEVEGHKITCLDDIHLIYDELLGEDRKGNIKNEGDYINFKVTKHNSDEVLEKQAKVFRKDDGSLSTGLSVQEYYHLDGENSSPKFTVNYNEYFHASGNSGGAMLCLSIYNQLVKEDVTKGNLICGTGTINLDGSIGLIGGIEQKVVKAYLTTVKVFFVDSGDYDAAVNACKEYGYDYSFIKSVSTFEDILEELSKLEEHK